MQNNIKTIVGTCYLILVLSGCSTLAAHSQIKPSANLMQQCLPLNELAGMTGADAIRNITENAAIYHDCADKHKALIDAVK